ncbi:family 10 glycosylhydrolase [Paenibacillus sp. DMB20]|uniref:family 10 glycosylhydrolase n=1 Tax=Paenibacillus sp. DMB20 TaxID=1642570 RepID=UPI000627ADDE|nr:family 10 glycosylhydrolase [Paenibacillus sp. DMB20]KKO54116.1 hypothetical protein XI25_08580 [Paenibacillus sp. DMB20]
MTSRRKTKRGKAILSWTMALLMTMGTTLSGWGGLASADSSEPLPELSRDMTIEGQAGNYEGIKPENASAPDHSGEETAAPLTASASEVVEEFEDLNGIAVSAVRGKAELGLVSRPETIHYGRHAVKLSYDFSNSEIGTSAAYVNFKDADGSAGRSIPGKPASMGVWVYGDGGNHWLRAQVEAAGAKTTVDLTTAAGLSWNGWKYVAFNLPASPNHPIKLHQIYVAELKDTNKNSGAVYFDRLTALYGNSKAYALDLVGLTPMKAGESQRTAVYATYADMTEPALITEGVTLTSSNENIATVTGVTYDTVQAVAPGEVTIIANFGDAPTAAFNLKVTGEEVTPQALTLSGPLQLEKSLTGKMKAYAEYEGYEQPLPLFDGVSYASNHPDIVSVSADGQLTAVAKGSAVITVTYKGVTAEHTITVIDPVPVLKSIELQGLTAVNVGDSFETVVMATYTWMDEPVKLNEGVVYASSRPEIASVDKTGKVTGLKAGGTRITASHGGKTSSLYITVNQPSGMPKAEMRAAWIATVENIDWPVKGADPEAQKLQYIKLLDQLEDAGMNAVIMQIKPTADAFYPSEYGPWSEWLTGEQGKNPGYNPLAFLIEETHKRNMEFHAWFNPYRVAMKDDVNRLVPDHPARQHPEWLESYGGKLYFNPGVPEAQKFILDGVMEVVKNYDIDAVHFDDYFYPYPVTGVDFPDADTYAQYGNGMSKADWRRNNVNQFVKAVSEAIKAEKSYVKFGISPFGIWRNKSASVPEGSETNGLSSYEAIYADSKKWIEEEWIDYITPQIYWYRGYAPAAYDKLIDWWSGVIKGKNVQLYSGQAVYRVGTVDSWLNPEEMPNQILYNRNYEEVAGSMYFSAKWFADNPLGFTDRLREDLYRYPALVPTMPWLDSKAPAAPVGLNGHSGLDGVKLSWKSKDDETYYAVYRIEGNAAPDIHNPAYMLGKVRKQDGANPSFVDRTAEEGKKYKYVVTAVDRLHNESAASGPATVHVKNGGGNNSNPEPPVTSPTTPPSTTPPSTKPPVTTPPAVKPPVTPPSVPPIHLPDKPVFKDIANVAWAKEAIEQLTAKGVVKGTGNGIFQPMKPVTRAEFLTMLVRAFDLSGGSVPASIKDVKATDWYYESIAAALDAGLAQGTGSSKFEPNRPITREEMAVMGANALKLVKKSSGDHASDALAEFKDEKSIAPYAKSSVALLVQEGILNGTGKGLFDPKGIANRAQAAAIVWNLMNAG